MATPEQPIRILAHSSVLRRIRRDISRRQMMAFAASAAGASFLAACGDGKTASTGGASAATKPIATGGPIEASLSMYSWGDYDAP